ncbi:MAG: O-antigen ligase family protein [Nitrospirae bacterium]|nr:O-antigen ligase family protein [Nitrospirota bacterium]
MEYLRKNYLNVALQLLGGIVAYRLGLMIADNPGVSVSGWIFALGPVIVLGISIAVIKVSAQEGLKISAFFSLSPLNIGWQVFPVIIVLAVALGASVALNPFDFIVPILIGIIIFLFLYAVYMVLNDKSIDGIGLLLISLPLMTYAEFEITRKIEFSLEWITIKIAIIMLFALIWFIVNYFINKQTIVKGKFNVLVLMFILVTFFSAVLSIDIAYSLKRWLFEIIYPIVVYFIVINSIKYETDIRRFMAYLVAGVFLNLTLVLYYFAKYGGSELIDNRYALYLNFADGVFVANGLIMVIPIVIAFLASARAKSLKLLFCVIAAMGIVGLVLSFARMAQISMAVGLLLFGLNKNIRKYAVLTVAVGGLVFIFNSEKLDPYLSKYNNLRSLEDVVHTSSMEERYGGWRAALGMFRDHPLTGVGIGRFNQEYANYETLYYAPWASGYVSMISDHNLYLNYLAETGMPGVLLLLTILSTIVAKGIRLVKKADSDGVFKYSLLISMIVFLSNNLTDGITFAYVKEIDKGLVFWSIAAVIMSYGAMGKAQGGHVPDRGRASDVSPVSM